MAAIQLRQVVGNLTTVSVRVCHRSPWADNIRRTRADITQEPVLLDPPLGTRIEAIIIIII
jgi:hypothetical protein